MRPEFYADLCRQYATYLRSYDKAHPLFKIASGANVDDYQWTKVVMEVAGRFIDAVSLHCYTLPHPETWSHKGAAAGFDRTEYFGTLAHTLRMEEQSRLSPRPWRPTRARSCGPGRLPAFKTVN